MPRTYHCPFWKWNDRSIVHCECAKLHFPDEETRREFIDRHCAGAEGWKSCSIAKSLQEYYDRH